MTIPVAIAGVLVWPGTPARPNKLFPTSSDLALAVQRLKDAKADTEEVKQTKVELLKQIAKDWKVYILTFGRFSSGILVQAAMVATFSGSKACIATPLPKSTNWEPPHPPSALFMSSSSTSVLISSGDLAVPSHSHTYGILSL